MFLTKYLNKSVVLFILSEASQLWLVCWLLEHEVLSLIPGKGLKFFHYFIIILPSFKLILE